jgi:hypothetical protein
MRLPTAPIAAPHGILNLYFLDKNFIDLLRVCLFGCMNAEPDGIL